MSQAYQTHTPHQARALHALVGGAATVEAVAMATGLTIKSARRALVALERGGYACRDRCHGPWRVCAQGTQAGQGQGHGRGQDTGRMAQEPQRSPQTHDQGHDLPRPVPTDDRAATGKETAPQAERPWWRVPLRERSWFSQQRRREMCAKNERQKLSVKK